MIYHRKSYIQWVFKESFDCAIEIWVSEMCANGYIGLKKSILFGYNIFFAVILK